jgi:hypothetical protein
MNTTAETRITDIKVDLNNLYREEAFTDLTFVTIRRLTPVKADGSPDDSREPIFTGMTQLVSPKGPVPVQFLIEGAKTLAEAAEKLPNAVEKTVQEMIAEARQMELDEASKIIVPGR